MPRIVPADRSSIDEAAQALRAGGVVAFPTETVYGLGAMTFNEHALNRVYDLKGRPTDNPLIAHVLDAQQAREVIAGDAWDERCEALASRFWPGPLTMVLPKSTSVPDRATAGRTTIAVRSPAHPVARDLIQTTGEPISAPSANRSGRVSPTTAQHVMDEFADVAPARDLMILDGGACEVGIESTVLDLTQPDRPRVLRPGAVTLEQLQEVLRDVDAPSVLHQHASPGTSPEHYAPTTSAELVATRDLEGALRRYAHAGRRCAVLSMSMMAAKPAPHMVLRMPAEAEPYARVLYQRLREADALRPDRIVIETPPEAGHIWRAVHDRLRRATATPA